MPHFILCCLFLMLLSCTNDQTTETTTTPEAAPPTEESKLSPPPPTCVYLTEATVLSYFPAEVKLPLPAHRAPGNLNSCQYDLEAGEWSATLVLDMPEISRQQAIIDEVAGAQGDDRATFPNGGSGKFSNEGRVLTVTGDKHFRIKFTARAKAGSTAPFSEAERRKLLMSMAGGVLGM